jgi:glycosyltransferase involved in cell wall biosynthesis
MTSTLARSNGSRRDVLAIVGGFAKPRESAPHGTQQAAFAICEGIARAGRYRSIDVYHEADADRADGPLSLPRTVPIRVFDKLQLPTSHQTYAAIYAANGEQMRSVPFDGRPRTDWAPVVCSIGTTHSAAQWAHLFVAYGSRSIRPTDGLIFKCEATREIMRSTWQSWNDRFNFDLAFPLSTVVMNGVDTAANSRSDSLRHEVRSELGLSADDVVFLAFSRLSRGTKGDPLALLVNFRKAVEQCPEALLILAGAVVDRHFLVELRSLARSAGVADRVVILENPFDTWPSARNRLMSAADAFVHMTTGVEESSSMVVHEAMAHGLPVVASNWAGMREVVEDGASGYLVPTRVAPVSDEIAASTFTVSSASHVCALSRFVACDWDRFVAAVVALARSPELRWRMGHRSRRLAEDNDVDKAARGYIEFFEMVSSEAERSSVPPFQRVPIVDVNRVLGCMARRTVVPADRIEAVDLARAKHATRGAHPEHPLLVHALTEILMEEGQGLSLRELAARLVRRVGGDEEGSDESELEAVNRNITRLVVRLLNYGALQLAPPSSSTIV